MQFLILLLIHSHIRNFNIVPTDLKALTIDLNVLRYQADNTGKTITLA